MHAVMLRYRRRLPCCSKQQHVLASKDAAACAYASVIQTNLALVIQTNSLALRCSLRACNLRRWNAMHCFHNLTAKSRPTDNVIAFKQTWVLRDGLQREEFRKWAGGGARGHAPERYRLREARHELMGTCVLPPSSYKTH